MKDQKNIIEIFRSMYMNIYIYIYIYLYTYIYIYSLAVKVSIVHCPHLSLLFNYCIEILIIFFSQWQHKSKSIVFL